ncbi:MAG: hypothetical protein AAF559_13430 [Pseudomonadota bacterium]
MMSEASFASLGPTLLARKGGAKPAMRPQLTPLPENMAEIAALADEQLEDLGWNDMGGDDTEPQTVAPMSQVSAAALSADAFPLLSSKPGSKANAEHQVSDPTLLASDFEDDSEGQEDDNPRGPHPIIDPLASADIVPFGAHQADRSPANEDTLDTASPVIRTQQKRLARRVLAEAAAEELARGGALEKEQSDALLRPKPGKSATKATKSRKRSSKSASTTNSSARRAAFTLRLDTDRHLKLRLAATMQGISAQSLVTEALDALLQDIDELDTLVERMKRTDLKSN